MTEFTPITSTLGGMLIGVASLVLLAFNGRIAGISGIVGGLAHAGANDRRWRVAFILGLILGGLGLAVVMPSVYPAIPAPLSPSLLVAGLLVGYGTRLGSGCTSGHGVCGISRFSPRSIVATGIFMTAGGMMVFVARYLSES